MNLRDDVFSSVAAQDMVTNVYQVSNLDDVECYCGSDQLDIDAVFRRGIDTPFSPSNLNQFETGSMAEDPILINEEQDRKNSAPHPTTPVSERPTRPPVLMRSRSFGT